MNEYKSNKDFREFIRNYKAIVKDFDDSYLFDKSIEEKLKVEKLVQARREREYILSIVNTYLYNRFDFISLIQNWGIPITTIISSVILSVMLSNGSLKEKKLGMVLISLVTLIIFGGYIFNFFTIRKLMKNINQRYFYLTEEIYKWESTIYKVIENR